MGKIMFWWYFRGCELVVRFVVRDGDCCGVKGGKILIVCVIVFT